MLYLSCLLIAVAVVRFIIDLHPKAGLSMTTAITNLIFALSLPACGIIGVRDKNLTCIQYFCCCNYFCAFVAFVSVIQFIVLVARNNKGADKYLHTLLLWIVFFMICKLSTPVRKTGRIAQHMARLSCHSWKRIVR